MADGKITRQRFTLVGKLGLFLLFAGPLFAGVSYSSFLDAVASNGERHPFAYLIFTLIAGVAFLAAIPMMIIGREFHHESPDDV
jgi:hypothetical protein